MPTTQHKYFTRFSEFAAAMLLAVSASGCATITKGSSQTVTVTTDPPGATCTLTREGAAIAAIPQTPGVVQIDKDLKFRT